MKGKIIIEVELAEGFSIDDVLNSIEDQLGYTDCFLEQVETYKVSVEHDEVLTDQL